MKTVPDSLECATPPFAFTRQRVIRFFVCLHAVALLTLPKDSGLVPVRPEDITAILLLLLFGVLLASGALEIPRSKLTIPVVIYLAYFLLVVLCHDMFHGYYKALVFWIKELSSIVFGYLVWRAYRTDPSRFLTVLVLASLPNLVYGTFQLFDRPRGMYGVAPFGHESSPASAGMVYLAISIAMFLKCLFGKRLILHQVLLVTSGVLLLMSGSKIAVFGALGFYGWYLLLGVIEQKDLRSLKKLGAFFMSAVIGISMAVSAEGLGYSWRGLARYRGLLMPVQVMMTRGIWWKIKWIDDPVSIFLGAGYSPAHLTEGAGFSYGMSLDNQVLYYLVTGGMFALLLYVILMTVIYKAEAPTSSGGKILRALVVSYCLMGLGGEVLQLSVHGNVFWMLVGSCLAMSPQPGSESEAIHATSAVARSGVLHFGVG